MATLLFVFGVIAAGSGGREYPGWRLLAEFGNAPGCEAAARDLGLKPAEFRCLPKAR